MRLAVGLLSLAAVGFTHARPTEASSDAIVEVIRGAKGRMLKQRTETSIAEIFTINDDLTSVDRHSLPQIVSRSPQRPSVGPLGKIPSLDQISTIAKSIVPKDVGNNRNDQVKCTNQEVSCQFLQRQAFDLQNDDDECLRIATSFDDKGKLNIQPLASSSDTVVYGLTTDGLTASAWCNDIGWTLRRIYSKCRKGKQCFGGQGYAARNAAFMITVGPKSGGPAIVSRLDGIVFHDTTGLAK